MSTYKFAEFSKAMEFMRQERKLGNLAVYFPRGGDTPRKFTTDPVEHVVMVLEEQKGGLR